MNLHFSARRLASIDELQFSAVLSDLDGVVYRGEDAIPGAVERFNHWHSRGVPYCFVTNNAEKSPAEFAEKIARLGIPCGAAQVVTSAEVALDYARAKYPAGSRAYVIGSASLKARVEQAGFVPAQTGASVVIVALDRQFDYAMMTTAVRNILAGAELIGTNPDVIRPIAGGFEPGTGAIVQSIAAAARVTPTILGKPAGAILELALSRLGAKAQDAIMLGDQIETDIGAARNAGIRGIFLETGVPPRPSVPLSADFVLDALWHGQPSA
jgi:4-nitrophenyl phosphatase